MTKEEREKILKEYIKYTGGGLEFELLILLILLIILSPLLLLIK